MVVSNVYLSTLPPMNFSSSKLFNPEMVVTMAKKTMGRLTNFNKLIKMVEIMPARLSDAWVMGARDSANRLKPHTQPSTIAVGRIQSDVR